MLCHRRCSKGIRYEARRPLRKSQVAVLCVVDRAGWASGGQSVPIEKKRLIVVRHREPAQYRRAAVPVGVLFTQRSGWPVEALDQGEEPSASGDEPGSRDVPIERLRFGGPTSDQSTRHTSGLTIPPGREMAKCFWK